MRSKFFTLLRLVILCLLFVSGGCGGGGNSDDGNNGNIGFGWVTIESPSGSPYTTESDVVDLSGETFINPKAIFCETDTGVTVTYTNANTGLSGSAPQRPEYCWYICKSLCNSSSSPWSASVALGKGDNDITIVATDGHNEGRASIRITRIREFTPPAVTATIPANGAADVKINIDAITATFSEQIDASTINEDSFTIMDGFGNPIIGSVTYQDKTATFKPFNNLDGPATYNVTITSMVEDIWGNPMTADYLWNFSTDPNPDTIPPSVIQEYPADDSSCSDIDTAIFVTFSEDMDSSSLNTNSFTLKDSKGNPILGAVRYDIYNNKFAFRPHYNLSYYEIYTATVTTAVKDLYGHNMDVDYIWSFSTLSSGSGTWQPISTTSAPERSSHTAVWSGTEMIVWGGYRYDYDTGKTVKLNTGDKYNPVFDTWQPISTVNAPSPRYGHTAVWTGTEMIVWGGDDGSTYVNTGGKYNPVFDTWQPISTTNAPPASSDPIAVWTGTELIVWKGSEEPNGGRYDPATDTWQPISTTNAPAIYNYTAIWTSREMIIWGYDIQIQQVGYRYDPITDIWQPISTVNAPSSGWGHTAVWTGTEMIVWGGYKYDGPDYLNTGGRYDPITDTWQPTSIECTPTGRTYHVSIWTGSEMIVWGGMDEGNLFTGGKYDPSPDSWLITDYVGQPTISSGMTAIWTGSEMIVWEGDNGARYQP